MKRSTLSSAVGGLCLAMTLQMLITADTKASSPAVIQPAVATAESVIKLYQDNCASCHGIERLGSMGPALLPQNLKRLRKKSAVEVISKGRAATQMPAFGEKLSGKEIQSLVSYIYTELPTIPTWDMLQILASRMVNQSSDSLSNKPVFDADLMNLFIVVELGDHSATLLNGDSFEPIHRFKTRFALHGGPKYSPDGRYVYFASRDGWISKFDIYNLKTVAEVRAGINTRNLAVSSDGRYAIVANYLPHNLVVLDTETLKPLKVIETRGRNGETSRVSAVYNAPPRNSFVAAMKDLKEVWEISYEDEPSSDFSGWVHDYRKDSGENREIEPFPVRSIKVKSYLDDFFFDQSYSLLLGASRQGEGIVLSLDAGRMVNELDIPGMPHLGSGITWQYQGKTVMATPNLKEGAVSIIDMESWETIKKIKTNGPGFFMRSHKNSPYAWVDVFFGPNKDQVHVIDKASLEIVKTLIPAPGKNAAHVEFTKDGRYALLSIWDTDGALVVYDAESLEEIKRLPMAKPSGKYNVFNKTRYESGTSH
ncbi:nitrite reductase [Motiliproteus sp. MSK22-1]|uniref:nitrite reductase n=1 Tax=Motiliproteus sp. MSK22-1 TaxID=1897630 RepID=UPI0018E9C2D7|nr:nitrite reductase [Motiliproteus sp. MSK22-1]